MKLSRSMFLASVVFACTIPFMAAVAQTKVQDEPPHEAVTDFLLFNGQSAVIPGDMGPTARIRYRTLGAQKEGNVNLYAPLFGLVQVDLGYGERETHHHLTGGLKVPVLYLSNAVVTARYEFNSFSASEPTFDEMKTTHALSGMFTGRNGRFGLSLELGYLISANSRLQGDLIRIAMQYAANDRLTYLMEFQRYEHIDWDYRDALTFGVRIHQLRWLAWEFGAGFYSAGEYSRDVGLHAALIFHPFAKE